MSNEEGPPSWKRGICYTIFPVQTGTMAERQTPSRFHLKEIATHLRRTVADIHPFKNKEQRLGHYFRLQGDEPTPFQTTVGWVEDGKDTMTVQIRVEGMRRAERIGDSLVFTTEKGEDGAGLAVTPEGVITFFPENIDMLLYASRE